MKFPKPTATATSIESGRIIERPDGYYSQHERSAELIDPFATREEAEANMQSSDEAVEPGETLEEAEAEIGIADWIDQETGAPAEESVPRIEDH